MPLVELFVDKNFELYRRNDNIWSAVYLIVALDNLVVILLEELAKSLMTFASVIAESNILVAVVLKVIEYPTNLLLSDWIALAADCNEILCISINVAKQNHRKMIIVAKITLNQSILSSSCCSCVTTIL